MAKARWMRDSREHPTRASRGSVEAPEPVLGNRAVIQVEGQLECLGNSATQADDPL